MSVPGGAWRYYAHGKVTLQPKRPDLAYAQPSLRALTEYKIAVDDTRRPKTIDLIVPRKPVGREIYQFVAPQTMCSLCHDWGRDIRRMDDPHLSAFRGGIDQRPRPLKRTRGAVYPPPAPLIDLLANQIVSRRIWAASSSGCASSMVRMSELT
jgi:hypothetical protein